MAQAHILTGAGEAPVAPVVRHITPADLIDALRAGWNDFSRDADARDLFSARSIRCSVSRSRA